MHRNRVIDLKEKIKDYTEQLNEVEGVLINALKDNCKLQGETSRVQVIKGGQTRCY